MKGQRVALAAWLLTGLLAGQTTVSQAGPPPAEAIKSRLIENFQSDQTALLRFVHREHVVVDKDGVMDGRTLRVGYVNGHEIGETIALDSRALSAQELATEHQRALARARLAAARPIPPPGMLEFEGQSYRFDKLADDYLYGPVRVSQWQGRTVWIYPAMPNPHVPSRSRAEKLLLHSQGEVWVDAEDLHVIRISIRTTVPARYGLGVLATIHSAGLDLQLEREAPGVWLPATADFSLQATVLLVKALTRSKQQSFYGYDATAAAEARDVRQAERLFAKSDTALTSGQNQRLGWSGWKRG